MLFRSPVRQWTIGANTAVLVYNDFSHNTAKYADNTDLNANNFSIIIKNFSLLDVNQYYTCSCGFSSDTIFLSLEESLFVRKYFTLKKQKKKKKNDEKPKKS